MTEPRTAHATMSFTSWDEDPSFGDDAPLPRLATALVAFAYDGDLVATSSSRSALSYGPDGEGSSLGFETVTGTLHGLEGGFVLRHEDVFTGTEVTLTYEIVAGSGTGALAGITGGGTAVATHGSQTTPFPLTYRLPADARA